MSAEKSRAANEDFDPLHDDPHNAIDLDTTTLVKISAEGSRARRWIRLNFEQVKCSALRFASVLLFGSVVYKW